MDGVVVPNVQSGADATAAILDACAQLDGFDNSAPTATGGGGVILLPKGDFWIEETIPTPPGVVIRGVHPDATRLRPAPGFDKPVVAIERPTWAGGYTRRSGLRDISIIGDRTPGQKGVRANGVAEVVFERANVESCDRGMDFEDTIVAKIHAGKVAKCRSGAVRGVNGCNGFHIDAATRLIGTTNGPNLEIDGGPLQGFDWKVEAKIESALDPVDGWGVVIGRNHPVQAIDLSAVYFENNKAGCAMVGSNAATGVSTVTATGGKWDGPPNTYGLRVFKGFVKLDGGWWDGLTAGYEIVLENGPTLARVVSNVGQPMSGPGKDNSSGMSYEDGTLYLAQLKLGGRDAKYGMFYANAPHDIRYAGDLPLFLAADLKLGGGDKKVGFFNSPGALKGAINGSRDGNAALANLLNYLASLGLLTNSTTA